MRRILVENARRKLANKRGGGLVRRALLEDDLACSENPADLLLVHEALDKLALEDAAAAQLVKLHFFAALTMDEAAQSLDMSTRSAQYLWAYARSWLRREMRGT
jgi:DNA-directed RNA polymerase specialized sigma24 family protein